MKSYITFCILLLAQNICYGADKTIQYFNSSIIGLPTTSAVKVLLPKDNPATIPPLAVRLDTYKEVYLGGMIYYDKVLGFDFLVKSISNKYSINLTVGGTPNFAYGQSKDKKTHYQIKEKIKTIVVIILNYKLPVKHTSFKSARDKHTYK